MIRPNKLLNFTLIIISIISIYVIFDKLADMIIPLVVALFISFAIIGLNNFYKEKLKLNFFFSSILSLFTYALIIFGIWKLIGGSITDLQNNLGTYQEKIIKRFVGIEQSLPFKIDFDLEKYASKMDLEELGKSIAGGIAGLFSNIGLIFFYVIFILFEYKYIDHKIRGMFTNKDKREKTINIINQIKNEISQYFYLKTIISFFTAFFSYIILTLFGLDFAIFWAFFIFVLNFVPNIGSIIAIFFPILLAFVLKGFSYEFIFLTSSLIAVQVFMGNIVDPKFTGNKLNLSPLVILVSLVFWGSLWGVAGMFLSVPIMIILNIVFSKFETTKPIGVLLSEKGDLKEDFIEEIDKKGKKLLTKIKNKFRKKK